MHCEGTLLLSIDFLDFPDDAELDFLDFAGDVGVF